MLGRSRRSCHTVVSVPNAPLSNSNRATVASSIRVSPWCCRAIALTDRTGPKIQRRMSTSWIECSSSAPRPARARICPPRRRVLALDRQVLVVGEVDRHHVARSLVIEEVANHHVAGQEAEDQPDLVDDAGLFDVSDHLLDVRRVDGERLLAEHGPSGGCGVGDEAGVLRRPRADEHDVGELHERVLAHGGGAGLLGEAAARAASGS